MLHFKLGEKMPEQKDEASFYKRVQCIGVINNASVKFVLIQNCNKIIIVRYFSIGALSRKKFASQNTVTYISHMIISSCVYSSFLAL